MATVLKFHDDCDFDDAQQLLKKAIDTMASPHFDHSIQKDEKTITILQDPTVIEGYLKKNGIKKYTKTQDHSWIGPKSSIASLVRTAASLLENLSELEHKQWMAWAKNILKKEDISEDRKKRWEKLFIPYDKLTEEEKDQDREYARKVMRLFKKD